MPPVPVKLSTGPPPRTSAPPHCLVPPTCGRVVTSCENAPGVVRKQGHRDDMAPGGLRTSRPLPYVGVGMLSAAPASQRWSRGRFGQQGVSDAEKEEQPRTTVRPCYLFGTHRIAEKSRPFGFRDAGHAQRSLSGRLPGRRDASQPGGKKSCSEGALATSGPYPGPAHSGLGEI